MRFSGRLSAYALATAFFLVPVLFAAPAAICQTNPNAEPQIDIAKELDKYPGLLPELGQLFVKLQQNTSYPPARHQSPLLPLLPTSTTYFVALPNYGETAHQALATFREELKGSAALRGWWQHGDMAKTGPEIESFIEKFSEVSQYLGDEIVLSGQPDQKNREFLLIAEVRKPGLKEFLRQTLKQMPAKSASDFRVLDPKERASVLKANVKPAE